MTKASDKLLGELHGKLAKSMMNSLAASEQASQLLEEFGDELPGAVQTFLSKLEENSPALLTAIAKFLKDNSITCSIEDNDDMTELQKRLDGRRKRVGNVIPMDV